MSQRAYTIAFTGQADRTLRAQFEDCEITTGPGTTIIRADVADQAALCELVQRIAGLGLEIIHLRLLTQPVPITGGAQAGHASSNVGVGKVPLSPQEDYDSMIR